MTRGRPAARAAFALAIASLAAGAAAETVRIDPPAEGSVSRKDGLAAWERIHDVVSHPRCVNCHVGPSDRPMWSGPSYGAARPHGMNIHAGENRIGAEYVLCSSCHTKAQAEAAHSAPASGGGWMLAPPEAHWFGQPAAAICEQLRDPTRNGGRNAVGLAKHLGHDLILRWAWSPGGGREPAPYSLQAHADDLLTWGAAGAPCPE